MEPDITLFADLNALRLCRLSARLKALGFNGPFDAFALSRLDKTDVKALERAFAGIDGLLASISRDDYLLDGDEP